MTQRLYPIFPYRFFGYGAPTSAEGTDGAIKFEVASGNIYGRADGAWSVIASLTPTGIFVPEAVMLPIFPLYLFGNGAPSNAFGLDGQPFIDAPGGGAYVRSGGSWYEIGTFQSNGQSVRPAPFYDIFPISLFGPIAPIGDQGQLGQIFINTSTQEITVNAGVNIVIGTASGGAQPVQNFATSDLSNSDRSLQPLI